jgi:hypothetical protein
MSLDWVEGVTRSDEKPLVVGQVTIASPVHHFKERRIVSAVRSVHVRSSLFLASLVVASIASAARAQEPVTAPEPVGAAPPTASEPAAQASSPEPAVTTPAAQPAAAPPVAEPRAIGTAWVSGPTVNEGLPSAVEAAPAEPPKVDTPWYERLKIRGYTQFRYNRLPSFDQNDELVNAQGDRAIGKNNGFSIRRARVILYGDVHERVAVYLQPDFASVIGEQFGVAIVRDWYADLFLDKNKEFRFRVGQSKVPFGFENMQSSQNRLALDRNDAINSAVKDERDLGVFFYYAPKEIRARFKHLVDSGLKGSGDYGVLALGLFNGQTANRPALSDDLHTVGRLTWPFKFGEQFVEVGAGGYFGKYYVAVDGEASEPYVLKKGKIRDARGFATLVVYPQPFGFQAEANLGVGPSQGDRGADDAYVIKARNLKGGYAQVMYKVDDLIGTVALLPFVRATYYDGGKKFETNAPHYTVKEIAFGLEWQIFKALEVVLAYDISDRTSSKSPYKQQTGQVSRIQVQVNY